jgi:hypothetical protein
MLTMDTEDGRTDEARLRAATPPKPNHVFASEKAIQYRHNVNANVSSQSLWSFFYVFRSSAGEYLDLERSRAPYLRNRNGIGAGTGHPPVQKRLDEVGKGGHDWLTE